MDVEKNATAQHIINVIQSESDLGLMRSPPVVGQPVFALWLCSSQLEVQLKPSHRLGGKTFINFCWPFFIFLILYIEGTVQFFNYIKKLI